jgi:hypothetical protein
MHMKQQWSSLQTQVLLVYTQALKLVLTEQLCTVVS